MVADPIRPTRAMFTDIGSGNGELRFRNVPDYENPADEGTNNIYNVTVQVSRQQDRTPFGQVT